MPKKPTTGLGLFLYNVKRLIKKALWLVVGAFLACITLLWLFIFLLTKIF